MKAILRSAIVAAGLATSVVAGMTSANASGGAGVFQGTAHIAKFGVGVSTGTASLTVVGVKADGTPINGHADATFTVNEPAATCPVQGSATGSTTGAVAVNFVWTRVGATAVITTSGDINGAGTAVFVVAGVPCGSSVDATVAGGVGGS